MCILTDDEYIKFFAGSPPIKLEGALDSNPIRHNGKGLWFFWNETWSEIHGPYESLEEAQKACFSYALSL